MRATPSVNVEDLISLSTDAVIVPSINESMLVYTSVPETAPSAYAGGTTYALGDRVSVASGNSNRDVYESLAPGNIGHTPASSPTFWKFVGRTYAAWASGTTYASGDIVLDAANHIEYVSLADTNLNHAVTDPAWWFAQPSNAWRMLDIKRNTRTVAPSPLVVTIAPGKRVPTLGLLGLLADRAIINVTKDGLSVYSETIRLSRRRTRGWYDYFYGTFSFKAAVARFNLPNRTGVQISVRLERAAGDVEIGALISGRSIDLGETVSDAQSDAENFSIVDHDEFGDSELVRRRMIPVIKVQAVTDDANVPTVIDLRELSNAIPIMWSGTDDPTSGYFEPLLTLAAWTRFTVTMDQPGVNYATVELELKEI